jgi:hypothetical protein
MKSVSTSLVNWYLEVELVRAEQVTYPYRRTVDMEPDPSRSKGSGGVSNVRGRWKNTAMYFANIPERRTEEFLTP